MTRDSKHKRQLKEARAKSTAKSKRSKKEKENIAKTDDGNSCPTRHPEAAQPSLPPLPSTSCEEYNWSSVGDVKKKKNNNKYYS
ncbi:hypothetical protein Hamer_G020633 [Homarus americanus]|uniref:Uncharacterized protein n=1 Tax=Homarus americanus TaxID=6706 RepID=A0A8J5MZQ1_HOMAM|nr:hypothetical protein Hamer_G020633 [Homarus americanus]